jgi:hypothetical protein
MAKFDKVMVIIILTYLVILVTMVYGPIAAMLVEMFPTRIRYTSMSSAVPHRQRLVRRLAAHHGLCHRGADRQYVQRLVVPDHRGRYTFVIGMLFIKETKDVDIYDTTDVCKLTGVTRLLHSSPPPWRAFRFGDRPC